MERIRKIIFLFILCSVVSCCCVPLANKQHSVSKLLERDTGGHLATYTFTKRHLWLAFGETLEIYDLPDLKLAKTITYKDQKTFLYSNKPNANVCLIAISSGMLKCFDDTGIKELWSISFPPEQFEDCSDDYDPQINCFEFSGSSYTAIIKPYPHMLIVNMNNGKRHTINDAYEINFLGANENIAAFSRLMPDLIGDGSGYYIIEFRNKSFELLWEIEASWISSSEKITAITSKGESSYFFLPNEMLYIYFDKQKEPEGYAFDVYGDIIFNDDGSTMLFGETCDSERRFDKIPVRVILFDVKNKKKIWASDLLPAELTDNCFSNHFRLIYDKQQEQILYISKSGFCCLNAKDGKIKWELLNNVLDTFTADPYAAQPEIALLYSKLHPIRTQGSYSYQDGKLFYTAEDKYNNKSSYVFDTNDYTNVQSIGLIPEYEHKGMIYSFGNGVKRLNPAKWEQVEDLGLRVSFYEPARSWFYSNYKLYPLFIFARDILAIGGKNKTIVDLDSWKTIPAKFFEGYAKFEHVINPDLQDKDIVAKQPFFQNNILVAREMVVGGQDGEEHIGDKTFQIWLLK